MCEERRQQHLEILRLLLAREDVNLTAHSHTGESPLSSFRMCEPIPSPALAMLLACERFELNAMIYVGCSWWNSKGDWMNGSAIHVICQIEGTREPSVLQDTEDALKSMFRAAAARHPNWFQRDPRGRNCGQLAARSMRKQTVCKVLSTFTPFKLFDRQTFPCVLLILFAHRNHEGPFGLLPGDVLRTVLHYLCLSCFN